MPRRWGVCGISGEDMRDCSGCRYRLLSFFSLFSRTFGTLRISFGIGAWSTTEII